MVKKEFRYRGKTLEELKAMSLEEFAKLLPSRRRISLQKTLTASEADPRKKLLKKIRNEKDRGKTVRTHCRDFVVIPEMVGMNVMLHNGKEFVSITIMDKMIGHVLGEFALTRVFPKHSSPGIGATRSTKFVSVR